MCYHQNPTEIIKQHEQDLLKVFRLIRDNIPRVMLNVVPPPSKCSHVLQPTTLIMLSVSGVQILVEFTGKSAECESVHHFGIIP